MDTHRTHAFCMKIADDNANFAVLSNAGYIVPQSVEIRTNTSSYVIAYKTMSQVTILHMRKLSPARKFAAQNECKLLTEYPLCLRCIYKC
jgi:hypothetical protein